MQAVRDDASLEPIKGSKASKANPRLFTSIRRLEAKCHDLETLISAVTDYSILFHILPSAGNMSCMERMPAVGTRTEPSGPLGRSLWIGTARRWVPLTSARL